MKIVFDKKETEVIKKLAIALGATQDEIKDKDCSKFKAGYAHMDERGILIKFHTGFIISAVDLIERKFVPMISMIKGMVSMLSKDKELKTFSKHWFERKPKKEEVIYYKLPSCHGGDVVGCTNFLKCDLAHSCMEKAHKNREREIQKEAKKLDKIRRDNIMIAKRDKASEVAVTHNSNMPKCFGKSVSCIDKERNCTLAYACKNKFEMDLRDSEPIYGCFGKYDEMSSESCNMCKQIGPCAVISDRKNHR